MRDLKKNDDVLTRKIDYYRQNGITLPTFAMMTDPAQMPVKIRQTLLNTKLWDVHPANLYRITRKNAPQGQGGLFGGVNHIIIPSELSGCRANIIVLAGRWFPTGAHKVGATFGCLVTRLIAGQFDPLSTKAVWPGNNGFGGIF